MTEEKAKAVLETREDAVIKAMIKSCWTLEDVQAYVSAANQIAEDRGWVYSMLERQAKKVKKGDFD